MEAGGMLRHGIIMLGYHNDDLSGDVLVADGELFGFWRMDGEEWCHFTLDGTTEIKCSAPSPWMLHDAIATCHRETHFRPARIKKQDLGNT